MKDPQQEDLLMLFFSPIQMCVNMHFMTWKFVPKLVYSSATHPKLCTFSSHKEYVLYGELGHSKRLYESLNHSFNWFAQNADSFRN